MVLRQPEYEQADLARKKHVTIKNVPNYSLIAWRAVALRAC